MFLFVFLIVLYVFEEDFQQSGLNPWLIGVAAFAGSAALTALFYALSGPGITPWLLGVLLLLFAFGLWRSKPRFTHAGLVGSLLAGVGLLWAHNVDGQHVFRLLSDKVAAFLALSNRGAEFLFGNLARSEYFFSDNQYWPGFGVQFAFNVLPTIIFFSAFMAVMYHLGVVQLVIQAMARFMHWSLKTSGSETTSVSANIFVGQTEAPFLIKPFLGTMTISELHAVMVGGFATIAGGVLAGYIQLGINPGHLIAASVMSAPAALVIAKLLYPETEHSETAGDVEIPKIKSADNLVGAAAAGTTDGLKLALNVGAMLIAFIALIAVADTILGFLDGLIDGRLLGGAVAASGEHAGFFPGSLRTFFGTVLSPLAWLMGVPWKDAAAVGNLLGVKLSVNEFVAYGLLAKEMAELEPRSAIIATYALCGFANFSSIGIQIGGISALAPERRSDLASVGIRAMFGGALASWTTATVAGILIPS
ncbi:MAG: NupC/NupG family nucleoside CNT transporter [Acidobacteria bacterium]|nr:MAG: NupC/NupG family nucleoside CNT transporter [Acidobacteriota bacterium]